MVVRTAKILVAVSNLPTKKQIQAYCDEAGYTAVIVSCGEDCPGHARDHQPDLIFLDESLPDMHGLDLCRALKADGRTQQIPVVLLVSTNGSTNVKQIIAAGAEDLLSKPVDRTDFMIRASALLRLRILSGDSEKAENVILTLARIVDSRDIYTAGHCERVAHYSVALGKAAGLSQDGLITLKNGGLLHDIGKINISESILNKPSSLDPEERLEIQKHPPRGEQICSSLESVSGIMPIVRGHHEKLDGTGYPDRLAADAIPLEVRIVAIADVYDAVTSDRPYRGRLSSKDAFRVLSEESERGWWDRELTNLFLKDVVSREATLLQHSRLASLLSFSR